MCGSCIPNETGGICPITRCPKGLLNGPCGGAKDGKCEVDNNNNCAWIEIYDRLKQLGQLESFLSSPIQTHDYSVNTKPISVSLQHERRMEPN